MKTDPEVVKAIKELYKDIDWDKFEDIDRALNWELWHSPLPDNYWTEVEPLDHYIWHGFNQASLDMVDVLDSLPHEIWVDTDGCVYLNDPDNDEEMWGSFCKYCGEPLHIEEKIWYDDTGGDCCSGSLEGENENEAHVNDDKEWFWRGPEYRVINPRQYMMFEETWKQVF